MPATPSTSDLTRQQLEELDALLQRMLSGASTRAEARKPSELPKESPLPLPPEQNSTVLSARLPMPAPLSTRDTVVDRLTERIDTSAVRRPEPAPVEVPAPVVNRIPLPKPLVKQDTPAELGWLTSPAPSPPMVPITPAVAYQPPPLPSMENLRMAPHEELPPPQYGRLDFNKPAPIPEPVALFPDPKVEPPTPVAEGTQPAVPFLMWPLFAVNWVVEGFLQLFGGEALVTPTAKRLLGWAGIALLAGAGVWFAYGNGYIFAPK